jgi:hypothetical protein
MARILDNPRAASSQPPAAKVLQSVLDKLRASAPGRRGNLRLVRAMTDRASMARRLGASLTVRRLNFF